MTAQIKLLPNKAIKIVELDKTEANERYRTHAFDLFTRTVGLVRGQLTHHFDKYGDQRLDDGNWLKVIIEEEGEAVQAINQLNYAEAYKEIDQVIACWMRMKLELERMEKGIDAEEREWYTRAK